MNSIVKTSLGILLLVVLINGHIKFDDKCQALKCNTSIEVCRIKSKCDDKLVKCVYYCGLKNQTSDELSYDEYYEYDEDETSDKNEFGEEDDYLDEYVEPNIDRTESIRKLGTCPKVVQAIGKCDTEKNNQPDCKLDSDCPGELKCCEVACGRRVCNVPMKTTISTCPTTFDCSLNCRLGYQTDSNGCLKCECQSCPSMDRCYKNCPSGYLKDLFACDICECNDQCPPFACNIHCPPGVGFIQSENGCPLCQCASFKSKPIETTSSCQEDVHCPAGFRCLNDARNVPMCQAVPAFNVDCPTDLSTSCNVQCRNGNYLLDDKGCPKCACAPEQECPLIKCRANCGDAGYELDEGGCQTCKCAAKEAVQCSQLMCRMYCLNGFKRDENGCEYCSCNESPQECPQLKCVPCSNGYKQDYSGCQTCECIDPPETSVDKCLPIDCNLKCKYGLQKDELGCDTCSCNSCPVGQCRMYCMYGFRKNEDGCDMCECDWTPVAEKISCSERIPCEGTRVCNLNLKLCEAVDPAKVNWFLYDFEVQPEIFKDQKFVQTFKNGFIRNVAEKYDLSTTQITVSSVESTGLTSFQIMPFFDENMEEFQRKMDQIDVDLNSHEFRAVLPAVVDAIGEDDGKAPVKAELGKLCQRLKKFTRANPKWMIFISIFLITLITLITVVIVLTLHRRCNKQINRTESKTPIYDTSYHPAPTDEDLCHAVHAPDGTTYVIVESDDMQSSNEKNKILV